MRRKLISDVGVQSGELVLLCFWLLAVIHRLCLIYLMYLLLYTVNLLSRGIILFGSEIYC
jgi:hypothetical protein